MSRRDRAVYMTTYRRQQRAEQTTKPSTAAEDLADLRIARDLIRGLEAEELSRPPKRRRAELIANMTPAERDRLLRKLTK